MSGGHGSSSSSTAKAKGIRRLLVQLLLLFVAEYLLFSLFRFTSLNHPIYIDRLAHPAASSSSSSSSLALPRVRSFPFGCDNCSPLAFNHSLFTCVDCGEVAAPATPCTAHDHHASPAAAAHSARLFVGKTRRQLISEYYDNSTFILSSSYCSFSDGYYCPTVVSDTVLGLALDTPTVTLHPVSAACLFLLAVLLLVQAELVVHYVRGKREQKRRAAEKAEQERRDAILEQERLEREQNSAHHASALHILQASQQQQQQYETYDSPLSMFSPSPSPVGMGLTQRFAAN